LVPEAQTTFEELLKGTALFAVPFFANQLAGKSVLAKPFISIEV
jgi:hypothetical protein